MRWVKLPGTKYSISMFNNETNKYYTTGTLLICPAGGLRKAIFENLKKYTATGVIAQVIKYGIR